MGKHEFFWFEYNNPLIVTIASLYLLAALRLNVKSRIVNAIAANSFAVYVISEDRWVRPWVYLWVYPYDGSYSVWLYMASVVVLSIIVFLFFCGIEELRKKLFGRAEGYVAERLSLIFRQWG